MHRPRRRTLGVAGCLALVVVVAVGVAVSRRGDDDRLAVRGADAPSLPTTTGPPATTETTYALVPLTSGVPIPTTRPPATTVPLATRTGPATPAAPAGGAAAALGSEGAVLVRPASPGPPRAVDRKKGCYSAVDRGWKVVECGALRSNGIVLLWLVESRDREPGLRALVLREQEPGQWSVVLGAADDDGTRFSSIGVRGEDLSGDGQPELVFGFHRRSPAADQVLAVDLVEATGAVAVHRELPRGSVRLAKGQLDTWAAGPEGPAEHVAIRYFTGTWRVASTERVERTAVPPSMV